MMPVAIVIDPKPQLVFMITSEHKIAFDTPGEFADTIEEPTTPSEMLFAHKIRLRTQEYRELLWQWFYEVWNYHQE